MLRVKQMHFSAVYLCNAIIQGLNVLLKQRLTEASGTHVTIINSLLVKGLQRQNLLRETFWDAALGFQLCRSVLRTS